MDRLKKIIASILCLNIILSSCPVMVFAADTTNITGVTGNNGVYNIEAQTVVNDTGYRQYTNFTLANTDTANLIYTDQYNKFMNMVDNRVEINGLLNTVKNGSFYNGHAIFVTPGGMVIGEDGVLNVGKLSLISTTSSAYDQYKQNYSTTGYEALITNASGDIIVNGKVMADSAEIYAGNITVERKGTSAETTTAESVGITANTDTMDLRNYGSREDAAAKFNSLVNAQVKGATSSTVDTDGTVVLTNTKLDAKDTVTINNESVYNATQYKKVGTEYILVDFTTEQNTQTDTPRNVDTTILLDNAEISGNEVSITATSSASGESTLFNGTGTTWSIIWDRLLDAADVSEEFKSLFSATGYKFFVGSRAGSEINIRNNSSIQATGNINVATNATATFKLDNKDQKAIRDFLFAFGTETKSKITVDGSVLQAGGNTNIDAKSSNAFSRKDESLEGTLRTGGLLTYGNSTKAETMGIFNFSYFNFSTVADTGVDIDSSKVSGAQTEISSDVKVKNDIWIDNKDTIAVSSTDPSKSNNGNGAIVSVFVNNADIENNISIADSEVEAKSGNLSVNASSDESINTKNLVRTTNEKIKTPTDVDKQTKQTNQSNDSSVPLDLFNDLYQGNTTKVQESFTELVNKADNKAYDYLQTKMKEVLPANSFKFGGVATLNSAENNQGITVTNSKLKASDNLVINSSLIFVHSNIAVGDAEKGDINTVGIGGAFILDDIDNDNLITISSNSKLDAGKDIDVDALTKMPGAGESGTIQFGQTNELIKMTIDFSLDDMTVSKPEVKEKKIKDWLKKDTIKTKNWTPALLVTGVFENQVASFSRSMDSVVDVAVSVLAAESDNNTKVDIRNSTLTSANGSIGINAVNRIQSINVIGIRELILTKGNQKTLTDLFNSDGLGGDVYYRDSYNSGIVNIEKSSVSASNGNVNVGSDTDQLYINLLKLGSKGNEIAEVTGSVSVQNLGGSTEVTVSGIENSESAITGKAVDINADDDVTVIDVNGSYSSNIGEGISFGAAVNVWNINRNVKAVVDHTTIVSTAGNTAVKASSENNLIEFALAGAYSGKGAAGVSGDSNSPVNKAVNRADDASANRQNVNVQNDDAGQNEEGAAPAADAQGAVNGVGESGNRMQFSLTGAGSVNVVSDDTDVIAEVKNSTIDSSGTTDVKASAENLTILGAGGVSDSTSMGAGAAANLYLRNNEDNVVRASVENTKVSSTDAVSVKANDTTDVYSFAAGVGIVQQGSDENDATITLGGSFDYNTVSPSVDAHIKDSTVEGKSDTGKADVSVDAEASTYSLSFSGGFTSDTKPGLSIGASIAATADRMGSGIQSYISGSTLSKNIGNVSVLSKADNKVYGIGVSAAVTTKSTSDFKFDGSLGIVMLENDISSEINNSTITADGGVEVYASNSSDAINLEGTVEFSGSGDTAVGVNGAVVIDKQSNKVSSSVNANVSASEAIKVLSNSYEQLNAVPITASIAKGGIKSLSNVVVNLVDNQVTSEVLGTITSGKDVTINANDETYLLTRGGTVGVDIAKTESSDVVLDFSVNYNKIAKTVDSSVKGAKLTADGDLSVTAASVDAIGALDGKKDEDELLNKDADGYYSSLNVEKDFSKWNMFYTLGASMSSGITASGSVIIDNVKNNVNASIGAEWYSGQDSVRKADVKARNVNVFAFDTGINNVFAGAIAGTAGQNYAASLGFQVIWGRNASTVSATVKQNTNLVAEEKTTIDAKSDKDTNYVVVAASGNTGKGLSISANGIYNRQKDDVFAGVDYSTLETGSLDINADNEDDVRKVMVGVSGSETVALAMQPIIDKQSGKVRSFINVGTPYTEYERAYFYFDYPLKNTLFTKIDDNHASSVLTKKDGVAVNSNNNVNTTDVIVGISGAQYVAGEGMGVVHKFSNHVLSGIVSAIIDSAGGLASSADSNIDVDNWTMGAAGALQGGAVAASVISNKIETEAFAEVSANNIKTTGDIKVNVSLKENIANNAAALNGSYQGGSLGLNLIFNVFNESSDVYIMGNSFQVEDREVSASAKSVIDRTLANRTILAGLNIFGAEANGAAVKTKNSSTSEVLFDNDFSTKGDVEVSSENNTKVSDTSVNVSAGAVGAGIGVNVFLFTNKGSTFSSLKKNITARNVIVNSSIRESYDQVNVGVDTGIGVIGVNVSKVKMGNTPVPTFAETDIYTEYEKTATSQLHDKFGDAAYDDPDPTTGGSNAYVGDVSGYFTNAIHVSGDLKVNAETVVDSLNLTNVNVNAGGADVGVGVHSVDLRHSTTAQIMGTTINADGNVEVSASHKDKSSLKSVGVEVAVVKVGVGANSYNNESDTQAVIYNTTINAANSAVSVLSSTETNASANNVEISLTGVDVNVLSHNVVDNAKASSLITGSTLINSDTLNLRSSGSMDISGGSTAVKVSVLPVDVNTNKVEGRAEISALIRDADGTTINVNNLNIVTDYSKMKVSAKNNIVAVSGAEVAVYNNNAYLKPVFNSGIDSTGSVVIDNKGTTLIETAKPTDSDNEFMLASSKIGGVDINVIKLYGGVTAKARSEAESNTFVNASDHKAADLVVNAYLNTKVSATADSDSFSGIGIDYVSAEGENLSNLRITTGGTNTTSGKILFNAQNVAVSDVDLNDISASLIAEVSVLRINSTMNANTTTNLSGTLNASEIEGNFTTDRTGKYSTSYHGGSAVHVNSTKVENRITGETNINLKNLTMNAEKITFSDKSLNTVDEKTKNSSGGLIDVGNADFDTDYNPKSKINLTSVNINSDATELTGSVDFNVDNQLSVKVQSKGSGGGLVSVKKSDFSQEYTANSEIAIKGSTIKTGDFNLSATSNTRTATDDQIQYTSTDKGFVTVSGLKVKTKLRQNNTVTINGGSVINVSNNIGIKVASDYYFRQYGSIKDDGFSSWPNVKTELTSENNNTVNISGTSLVSADNELTITFDSSGNLYTKSFSKARNFGSKVKSTANVTLTVNNNLNVGDNGSVSTDFTQNRLHGGNYVGVNFMGNSSSDVDHESYAQANAVVPDTSQNGTSKKTVNNTFNLYSNGSLETNRDIEVNFSLGNGSVTSWNHYKRVYYVAFGYTKKKSYRHNVETNHNPVFNMSGALSAGFSDNWILEIDADENIVKSVGFRSSSFEFVDATDAQDLKNQKLLKIDAEIQSLELVIAFMQALRAKTTEDLAEALADYRHLGDLQTAITEESIQPENVIPIDKLREIISSDRMQLVVERYEELGGDATVAENLCEQLLYAYSEKKADGTIWNYEEMDDFVRERITDQKFLSAYYYSAEELEDKIISVVLNDSDMQFISYSRGTAGGWYIGYSGTDIETDLANAKTSLEEEYKNYVARLAEYNGQLIKKESEKQDAEQRYAAADLITPEEYEQKYGLYSIVFDNIYLTSQGSIKINGVDQTSGGSPTADYPAPLYPDTNTGTIRIKGPGNNEKLQFYVGTGGLEITNYSNRSLMFSDVQVTDNNREDKLVINGTIRNDLIKEPSSPYIVRGITIRNLMDVTHPFYTNETGHNLKDLNNIAVNGVLLTNTKMYPITVTSQSGDVRITSMKYETGTDVTIGAEQGNLIVGGAPDGDGNYVFNLESGKSLVAGKLLRINADIINIGDNATLTAGMIDKKFMMDGKAPETTTDPVTGENILLANADEGTTIKALYVDGRYELFTLRESDGSVQFAGVRNPDSNPTVTLGENANITVNHGFSNVYVLNSNDTDIMVHGIENIRNDNAFYPALVGIEQGDKVTVNVRDEATVNLSTKNSITIAGRIVNGFIRDEDGNLNRYDGDNTYVQVSNYGETGSVIIEKISETEPSIRTGGFARVFNNNSGSVFVFGGIDATDIRINQPADSEDATYVDEIVTDRMSVYAENGRINVEDTDVRVYGSFETPDKTVEVDNDDITINDHADIKLYTGIVGAFSMDINTTNRVVTDAPAVYARGGLLIRNMLGYHTFETLSYSEANTMNREAKTVSVKIPYFTGSLIDSGVKLVQLEED